MQSAPHAPHAPHLPQISQQPGRHRLLQDCPLTGIAPFEIHGARARGCKPSDDYLFQGFRYVLDVARDVLVREDVDSWIAEQANP